MGGWSELGDSGWAVVVEKGAGTLNWELENKWKERERTRPIRYDMIRYDTIDGMR